MKRLYSDTGSINETGRSFDKEVSLVIGKLIDTHPDYNLIDMEHAIVVYAGYHCALTRLKESMARAKARKIHDNSP